MSQIISCPCGVRVIKDHRDTCPACGRELSVRNSLFGLACMQSGNSPVAFVPTDAQIALLQRINSGSNLSEIASDKLWNQRNRRFEGTVKDNVAILIKNGLLGELSTEFLLANRLTKAELKQIAQDHGLKTTGTKVVLAERIAPTLSNEEDVKLLERFRGFGATKTGKTLLAEFSQRWDKGRDKMASEALSHLRRGDVGAAMDRIDNFEPPVVFDFSDAPGFDVNIDGMEEWIATFLLSQPYDDLPYDSTMRNEIGASLAVAYLLGARGDGTQRLLELTDGKFSCPAITEWLLTDPCGINAQDVDACTSSIDKDEDPQEYEERRREAQEESLRPNNIASTYARTQQTRAISEFKLKHILEDKDLKDIARGIRIFPIMDDCPICTKGKLLYRWSEVAKMPRIPRHWGCRCAYGAWVK